MDCVFRRYCLPAGLEGTDIERFNRIVERRPALSPGKHLYRIDARPRAVFAIRSGAVKTYLLSEHGEERVTGFGLPGEVVGLDSISTQSHPFGAQTLDYTTVCRIPLSQLSKLIGYLPGLHHQVLRLLSRKICAEERLLRSLAGQGAEGRLASALVDLLERFSLPGQSQHQFQLPMSQRDLASYLGLTHETVSRHFRQLADQGLILIRGRAVQIHDAASLRKLADHDAADTS